MAYYDPTFEARRNQTLGREQVSSPTPTSSGFSSFEANRQQILSRPAQVITPTPTPQPQPNILKQAAVQTITHPPGEFITKPLAGFITKTVAPKVGNFIDQVFKIPDKAIDWAGEQLAKPENIKITKPLAFVQEKIIEPVFESDETIRGIQRGVAQTYLGDSKRVSEVFTKKVDQPVTFVGKAKYTVGEIVGTVAAYWAGGEIIKGLGFGKATLPVLFTTLGQTSTSTDATVTQRIEKAPVDAVTGWLFSKLPVSKKIVSVQNLKGLGGSASILAGQTFVDSLIEGLPPEEAAKSAAKMAVIGGLLYIAASSSGLVGRELLKSKIKTGEIIVTPQEARNKVIGTELEGTPLGKEILKQSFEAETQGMDMKITGVAGKRSLTAKALGLKTPEGISVNVELVAKRAELPTAPVEEVKPVEVPTEKPVVPTEVKRLSVEEVMAKVKVGTGKYEIGEVYQWDHPTMPEYSHKVIIAGSEVDGKIPTYSWTGEEGLGGLPPKSAVPELTPKTELKIVTEVEKPVEKPTEVPPVEKPPVTKVSEEFKVGDVIDTQGHSNMKSPVTIREVKGNSLYFTDAEGTDFSGTSRSTVRNLIKEGAWKKIQQPTVPTVKPTVPPAKPTEIIDLEKKIQETPYLKKIIDLSAKPLANVGEIEVWQRYLIDKPTEALKKLGQPIRPAKEGMDASYIVNYLEDIKNELKTQPLGVEGVKPPTKPTVPTVKPVKVSKVTPARIYRTVTNNGRGRLPVLNLGKVKDGKLYFTNLETAVTVPTDLPDGMYSVVGEDLNKSSIPADEFPTIPMTPKPITKIDAGTFQDIFTNASKFTSSDEGRPILTGVQMVIGKENIIVRATDGYRLFREVYPAKSEVKAEIVVPTKDISRLLGLFAEGDVEIRQGEDMVSFNSGETQITTRILDGQFPDGDKIYPEFDTRVEVSNKELGDALKQIVPYTKETAGIVKLEFKEKEIIASGGQEEAIKTVSIPIKKTETISETVMNGAIVMPVRLQGVEATTDNKSAFNIRYLEDARSIFAGENLYLDKKTALLPMHISDTPEKTVRGAVGKVEVVIPAEPVKKPTEADLGYNPKNLEDPGSPKADEELAKLVRQSEIAKNLSEKLNVPIRRGKFQHAGAIGLYKPKPKTVRIKAGGIRTIFHEVGHYLDDTIGFSDDIKIEERKALMQEYGFTYTGQAGKQRKEAFAEYLRLKMTGQTEKIKMWSPNFDKVFNEKISKMPEVKEVIDTATVDFKRWNEQPATAKVLSQISIGSQNKGSLRDRIANKVHDIYTGALDDLHPLSEYMALARRQGIETPAKVDPYVLARNLRGWVGKADLFLNKGTFGKTFWKTNEKGQTVMNFNGKSYSEIMKPIEDAGKLNEFRVYVVSQRIINDLAPRGIKTGISIADARAALQELGTKNPEFEKVAAERRAYKDRLLDFAEQNGLVGKEGLVKIKELNKFHVPFYRVMEESGVKFLGKSKLAGNLGSPIKRIKGSEREIIDPFESDVKDTYAIINAAERNNVGIAMANVASKNYELGRLFEKVDRPMKPITVNVEEVLTKALQGSGLDTEDIPEDLGTELVTLFRPTQDRGANMLNVNAGDKQLVFQVDPDLFKAIQGLNAEDIAIIIKLLAYPAKWLRAGATLSPDFSVRNPLRDQFTAFCYSKYGFIPGIDLIRGMWSLFRQDNAYLLWKAGGGEHAMMVSLDREYLQRNLDEVLQGKGAVGWNLLKHPLKLLQIISEYGEAGTRLGEFRQGLRAKADPIEAVFSSRNVTLDFGRIGSWAKAINTQIAFFNANNQGTDTMIRNFRYRPFKTLFKTLLAITLPSILLYLVNRDDKRWKEIPQWNKDLFWIVFGSDDADWDTLSEAEKKDRLKLTNMFKYGIYRIPKPFELGIIFGSIPERIMEVIDTGNPEVFNELRNNVVQGFTPGFFPTAILPIWENISNYSMFLGRPIVSRGAEGLPPEEQTGTYTSELARLAGKVLKYSPAKIDNLIYGYSGGLGRYATEGIDKILVGTNITTPPSPVAPELADTPVLRAFMIRNPIVSSPESVNRIYVIYAKTTAEYTNFKRLTDNGEDEKAEAYLKDHPEIANTPLLNNIVSNFSDMNKIITQIRQDRDLTPEEKRIKITDVSKLKVDLANQALDILNEK